MQNNNEIEEKEIIQKINSWFKKFTQSHHLKKIDFPAFYWAHVVIGYFCFCIFLEKGLNPETWDQFAVKQASQKVLSLELKDDFKEYVPQILSCFLSFLEQNSALPQERKLSSLVKDVSLPKSYRKRKKKNLTLFAATETGNTLFDKLKENNKVKQWLARLEKTAQKNVLIDSTMSDIFSFADVISVEYQNEIQDFYIHCNEEAAIHGANPESDFFEVLADFSLVLDWPLVEEKTITDMFYDQQKEKLNKREKEILSAIRDSFIGIYQVKEIQPSSYTIKDIFTEKEIEIKSYGGDLSTEQLLICRLLKLESGNYNVGSIINISSKSKRWLKNKIKSCISSNQNQKKSSNSAILRKYIINNPITFIAILNEINQETALSETFEISEAYFTIQSKKIVYDRLTALPHITVEKNEEISYDVFIWNVSDKDQNKAVFLLFEDHLLVRAYEEKILKKAIDLIQEKLSFTVTLKSQEIVSIPAEEIIMDEQQQEGSKIDAFWETQLDVGELGERSPRELAQTEQGREMLKMLLGSMELLHYFDHPQAIFNKQDLLHIREELDMTSQKQDTLHDGVEKLLVQENRGILNRDTIIESIMLWRYYKYQVNNIRGRDKSFAAAVEYLKRCLDFDQVTQKEVGQKYGVSPNTISQKYNMIAEQLNINISGGVPSLLFDYSILFD